MALMIIIIGLGLAGAALIATVQTQRGSVRDQDYKAAIAAADAGLTTALFRQNRLYTPEDAKCVVATGGDLQAAAPQADGWCPEQTGTVGNTSFRYRVRPWVKVPPDPVTDQNVAQKRVIKVVAWGYSDDITRRIAIDASAPTGVNIMGPNRTVGLDWVAMDRNSYLQASTGSNGDVHLINNAEICGNIMVGGNFIHENNSEQTCGTVEQGFVNLPPPDLEAARILNANGNFFAVDHKTGNPSWNKDTMRMVLSGSDTVTLNGTPETSDYLFCQLEMSGNSQLIMAQGAHIRIFFEEPERCGLGDGDVQIKVTGTSSVQSTAFDPDAGIYDLPGFFVAGSDNIRVAVVFNGTSGGGGNNQNDNTQELVLYAPRNRVEINGTTDYYGSIAGKTLYIGGTSNVIAPGGINNPDLNVDLVYKPERYVECTGDPGASPTPDADC